MEKLDQLSVTFTCFNCGAKPATLELPDDYSEDSVAKCKACGVEVGRWGDIKAKSMELAKGEVREMLRKAFRGRKGWSFK